MFSFLMPSEAQTDSHVYVEYLKERIYGMLTLMAVSAGLLVAAQYLSIAQAAITIAATASGLWIASLLASYAAWQFAHDEKIPRYRLVHEIAVHRGLLLAALPALGLLGVAATGAIDLQTALIADIVLSAFSLATTFARAAKTKHNSLLMASVLTAIQVLIVLGIVWLKASSK